MMTDLLLALPGWILAALFAGLWYGERGRRMDAQEREGVIQPRKPAPAEVLPPQDYRPTPELQEARELFIRETVAEIGCTEEQAGAEYDRLYTTVMER